MVPKREQDHLAPHKGSFGPTLASAIAVAQTLSVPGRQSCRHLFSGRGEPCVPKKRRAPTANSRFRRFFNLRTHSRQLFISISSWATMGQAALATRASLAAVATWNLYL